MPGLAEISTHGAQRCARRDLRAQIAQLERELTGELTTRSPRASRAAPRLLSLGELEERRDALVERRACELAVGRQTSQLRNEARARLEAMIADPVRHRGVRVSSRELGDGGCGEWRVRPRLGLLGRLAGWWEITLSSGCPLRFA